MTAAKGWALVMMRTSCLQGLRAVSGRRAGGLLVFCLGSLLLTGSPARGQEDEAPEGARRPGGRVAWFAASDLPKGLANPVKVLAGGEVTEVLLPKREPSLPVKIPADGIISIVREIENPDDPSKPAYQTLARAVVAEGVKKALIILVPAAEKEAPLVYHARVEDLARFKGGDYLFLNLTTAKVAVQMGETKIGLEPGRSRIYEAPAGQKALNVPISYHFYDPEKEKWRLLSASTVVVQPTRREICFFSWDPRFNRIDYHGITLPVVP